MRAPMVRSTKASAGTAPRRRWLVVSVVAGIGLAACSSSSGGSNTAGGSSSSSGGGSTSGGSSSSSSADSAPGVAEALATVAKYRATSDTFTAPGPAFDATSLKGGSLYYVSLSQAIPVLAREQEGIKQAATALGMSFHVCDGKFQPAQAASCINAAVSAGATGIFTDSIVIDAVSTAAASAASKNIPIVALSAIGSNTKNVTYVSNGDELSHMVSASWIVADSGGKAKVLQTGVQDDSGAINDITTGSQPVFDKCTGCNVVRATYTAQTVPGIPSLISSSLLKNRDRDYGFPQFDFLVPLFKSGVQTAGFTAKMKIVSTNAVVSSMQLVKSGGQAADAGSNRNYSGWAAADTMARMIKGQAVAPYTVPVRLFDKTNIASVTLTEAAATSGEWFGSLAYQQDFQKLWGLS